MALGSTVTRKSNFLGDSSLQTLDSSGGTHARTYTQSRQMESTVERLLLNSNWLLTGLFSLQWSSSNSAECKFEKSLGFQNMCHSAIGMKHKLIHGQWVIFGALIFIAHKKSCCLFDFQCFLRTLI